LYNFLEQSYLEFFRQFSPVVGELVLRNIISLNTKSNKYDITSTIPTMELSFGFEDVAIKQKKSICDSRLDVEIKSEVIQDVFLDIPLIASNMSTVTNSSFCIKLASLGAMGVMHRALPDEKLEKEIKLISKKCQWTAASVGVGDSQLVLARKLIRSGANILFIDIAHGYTNSVIEFGANLKREYPSIKIVVGNTTNIGLLKESCRFASACKVGIASGSACETKNTAGCTEKQFSAVLKFKELSRSLGIPVISDGGTREPADFVKALGAGANSVMAGMIFARCPESAAKIVKKNGVPKKLYAGMASRHVQNQWKGGVKEGTCTEGGIRLLDVGESAEKLIERYSGALRSGITYAGGNNIQSFQDNVEFIRLR
jgi:IMP dehydrogenase